MTFIGEKSYKQFAEGRPDILVSLFMYCCLHSSNHYYIKLILDLPPIYIFRQQHWEQ